MAQKFGNGLFTGVTLGAGASAGIPVSVLVNRIGGKKIALDSLGRENASALSFTIINTALGTTAATQDQLIAQTYVPSALPTGVYGSPAALAMLAKLKAGVDSVDVYVIGDSNAGSPGSAAGDGWLGGIARGLWRGCCGGQYATAIWPAGLCYDNISPASAFMYGAYRSDNTSNYVGQALNGAAGMTLKDGKNAPNDLKRYLNPTGILLGFGTAYPAVSTNNPVVNFLWADGAGVTYGDNNWMSVFEWRNTPVGEFNAGLDTRNALTYRVVHSVVPGHTGATAGCLRLIIRGLCSATNYQANFGSSNITYAPGAAASDQIGYRVLTVNGLQGVTGITASKYTWAADSNRVGVTISANFLGLPGFTTAFGPFAAYYESMHCNTKGWSVTQLAYLPGATTQNIANQIVPFGATTDSTPENGLRTLFKETRERQIEAGGSGNVIVFLNSGINDVGGSAGTTETAGAAIFPDQLKRMISTFKREWDGLGYPENDLAFIITVSAPSFNTPAQSGGVYDWNLDSVRVAGKNYSQTAPDYSTLSPYSNVAFVNITELGTYGITQGGLTLGNAWSGNANFYANDGLTVHLTSGTTGGYAYLGELLVNRCLRYQSSIQ
jgi:hypothetical protein